MIARASALSPFDEAARRLRFVRPADGAVPAAAIRYSGAVTIELTYEDSDQCYDGKVIVYGYTYSVAV